MEENYNYMEENYNYMNECGICFKEFNNNLISNDIYDDTDEDSEDDDNDDDNNDDNNNNDNNNDDNNNYKAIINKNKFIYNPISVNLLECKTNKCYYKLCDECKEVYYIKYKNKNCPNCREKIENIDEIIQNLEEQNENNNQILIENIDNYYFPNQGLCRISVIYCKNCLIFTSIFCIFGFSSFFFGALIINPKFSDDTYEDGEDDKDDEDDKYDDLEKISKKDVYILQIVFGFIVLCFILNILRCCLKIISIDFSHN